MPKPINTGFLPAQPIRSRFILYSHLNIINDWTGQLTTLENQKSVRKFIRTLDVPEWPSAKIKLNELSEAYLYCIRLMALACAYEREFHSDQTDYSPAQVGNSKITDLDLDRNQAGLNVSPSLPPSSMVLKLPNNLATPLVHINQLLSASTHFSYFHYVLLNSNINAFADETITPALIESKQGLSIHHTITSNPLEKDIIKSQTLLEYAATPLIKAFSTYVNRNNCSAQQEDEWFLAIFKEIDATLKNWCAIYAHTLTDEHIALYATQLHPFFQSTYDTKLDQYQGNTDGFSDDIMLAFELNYPNDQLDFDVQDTSPSPQDLTSTRGKEHNYSGTLDYIIDISHQSPVLPLITAFLKIPHKGSRLTQLLNQYYEHSPQFAKNMLNSIEYLNISKSNIPVALFNRALESLLEFRALQLQWIERCQSIIHSQNNTSSGTGLMTEEPVNGTEASSKHQLISDFEVFMSEIKAHKIMIKPSVHHSLEIIQGNIFDLDVNAIVRPAHRNLYTGRGVSQTLFKQAGPELFNDCRAIGKVDIGSAHITPAYNLQCDVIIHTVPPHWSGGDQWGCNAIQKLRECYENSIRLAIESDITTLAFVSLGTGSNQFPHAIAAHQALEVLTRYEQHFHRLIVCLSKTSSYGCWMKAFQNFRYSNAA